MIPCSRYSPVCGDTVLRSFARSTPDIDSDDGNIPVGRSGQFPHISQITTTTEIRNLNLSSHSSTDHRDLRIPNNEIPEYSGQLAVSAGYDSLYPNSTTNTGSLNEYEAFNGAAGEDFQEPPDSLAAAANYAAQQHHLRTMSSLSRPRMQANPYPAHYYPQVVSIPTVPGALNLTASPREISPLTSLEERLRENLHIPANLPVALSSIPSTLRRPTQRDLVAAAIFPHGKLTLNQIYEAIRDRYEAYRDDKNTAWKSSVRHLLSLHMIFVRVGREVTETGKGDYWALDFKADYTGLSRSRKRGPGESKKTEKKSLEVDDAGASLSDEDYASSSSTSSSSRRGKSGLDKQGQSVTTASFSSSSHSMMSTYQTPVRHNRDPRGTANSGTRSPRPRSRSATPTWAEGPAFKSVSGFEHRRSTRRQ